MYEMSVFPWNWQLIHIPYNQTQAFSNAHIFCFLSYFFPYLFTLKASLLSETMNFHFTCKKYFSECSGTCCRVIFCCFYGWKCFPPLHWKRCNSGGLVQLAIKMGTNCRIQAYILVWVVNILKFKGAWIWTFWFTPAPWESRACFCEKSSHWNLPRV